MLLKNVTKKYENKTVYDHFSAEFESGKITAILGESGVGKTTLLNLIAGLEKGEGKIEGVGDVIYLFQSPRLLPNLTVKENLEFVLPKERYEEISPMLEKVGLKGYENRYPVTLSGGEARRVSIARAFLSRHDTLLLDEPFSSLDLKLKEELIVLVYTLWQEKGSTVLFVTHDVREASTLAHRAVVLKEGEIVCDVLLTEPMPRDFLKACKEEETLLRALLAEK